MMYLFSNWSEYIRDDFADKLMLKDVANSAFSPFFCIVRFYRFARFVPKGKSQSDT